MPKINLTFKDNKKLSQFQIDMCQNIISYIFKYHEWNEWVPVKKIAQRLKMTAPNVRHYIKLIRENNDTFFQTGYLIASPKGYQIEDNKKKLKKYYKKLEGMTHSKIKQLDQLLKSIESKN